MLLLKLFQWENGFWILLLLFTDIQDNYVDQKIGLWFGQLYTSFPIFPNEIKGLYMYLLEKQIFECKMSFYNSCSFDSCS